MSHSEKMSVALTPELAAMVREAVAGGEYASSGEVVREALGEWKRRRTASAEQAEELRRLWQEGLDSGPGRDGDEAFARLRGRLRAGELLG